jgi:ADP-heptose:LPS heptosyltransferase
MKVLVVLGGGIGNIVQATPAIKLIASAGHIVDLRLFCNSTKDVKDIFKIPSVRKIFIRLEDQNAEKYDVQLNGPFTPGKKFPAKRHLKTRTNYAQHKEEAKVYADLADQIGIKWRQMPAIEINPGKHGPEPKHEDTVAIYPGSKPDWAMKRWDKYDQLASKFKHVTLVGTPSDIDSHGNPAWIKKPWKWPSNVSRFHGTLKEAAHYISKCKIFVGNDGGLAHVAGGCGIPTFVLFGPTSVIKNKPFGPNAHAVAISLKCRPCQFKKGKQYFRERGNDCPFHMKCMKDMSVDFVYNEIAKKVKL